MTRRTTIAVALDGAGWHPAAWRDPSARPAELFSPGYWIDLARTAERAGVDLLTIEDALGLQSSAFGATDDRTDEVRGRLDALLIASLIAPATSRIGLVPTVTTTHTEPFHVATGLQTLDFASRGRAGMAGAGLGGRARGPSLRPPELRAPRPRGRAPGDSALLRELFDEARDVVEVVRRLWDSWEDDAIIRDAATARFVDRDKLHYADFEGAQFSVKGPSITPRSPQGQPLVTALAHQTIPYELAATSADLVFVTPHDDEQARSILGEVRDAESGSAATAGPSRCSPTSSCSSRRRPRSPPPRSNASTPSTARPRHPTP